MPQIITADPNLLHWPARVNCLESIEDHANQSARLARALWTAIEGLDADIDERDKWALYELAGAVSDHASAAVFALYMEYDRTRACLLDDPINAVMLEWGRLEAIHIASIATNDRLGTPEADKAQDEAVSAVRTHELETVLKTAPTTKAGALQLLRWISRYLNDMAGGEASPAINAAVDLIEETRG